MEQSSFLCEKFVQRIKSEFISHKVPFISSMLVGLLAYVYVFTNKLVNLDDIEFLFSKGASLSSGRWGLDILSHIIPNYSMPWFHGIITLTLMSVSVCIIIDIFKIKNKLLQGLLAGIIISFPSLIGTFSYMFTSSSYAISFLFAVLAIHIFEKGGKRNAIISCILLIFSLSIYQAYITVTSSLFIVLLIQSILENQKSTKEILIKGIKYVSLLAVSIIIYLAITKLLFVIFDTSFNSYINDTYLVSSYSLPFKLRLVYEIFIGYFTKGFFSLIDTTASQIVNILCLILIVVMLLYSQVKAKNIAKTFVLLLLIVCLPLSINCFVLLNFVHTLMVYGFIALYVLAAIAFEALPKFSKSVAKEALYIALAIIVINNVYIANRSYLQMHLTYENAYSFYTSLVTQIKMRPEFDQNTKVALIGRADNYIYEAEEFGDSQIMGIDEVMINAYSKEEFIKYYIGFDIEFASEEQKIQLAATKQFKEMPEYPYYGSIQKIEDYIVVNLGAYD